MIILTSFTSLNSSGGVPRWNRDFISAFEKGAVEHYSFDDIDTSVNAPNEWEKAITLNSWLRFKKKLKKDDILIGDGFWANSGNIHPVENTISVSHGNWSHTTLDDVKKGIPPEFPEHHNAQLNFRKRHQNSGGKMVAVSDFIAYQGFIQWGFSQHVINNGIDLDVYVPTQKLKRKRPLIIHGVTNTNKGYEHVKALKENLDVDVLLLDEAAKNMGLPNNRALAQADLVVIPSAHEGNSYFCLESLSCGIPVVCYDVGLMFRAKIEKAPIGIILDRNEREDINSFVSAVVATLINKNKFDSRDWVRQFSIQRFRDEWRNFIRNIYEKGI